MPSAHEFIAKTDGLTAKVAGSGATYTYSSSLNAWEQSAAIAGNITGVSPTTFTTNNVVLTGVGFTGATAVSLNDQSTSFAIDSDTQITISPAAVAEATETLIYVTTASAEVILAPVLCTQNPTTTDPDADAVVDAITATGATLTSAQEDAVRDRIEAFKTDGLWADLAHYYGAAGGTQAAHAIDWKDPSGTTIVTVGTGAIHSASGIQGRNSTVNYLDLGFAASSLPLSTVSMFAYVQNAVQPSSTTVIVGAYEDPNYFQLQVRDNNQVRGWINSNSFIGLSSHSSVYESVIRRSATEVRTRIGANSVVSNPGQTGRPTGNLFLFAVNASGNAAQPSADRLGSLGFFGIGLSDAQDDANKVSEDAYQAAMGR